MRACFFFVIACVFVGCVPVDVDTADAGAKDGILDDSAFDEALVTDADRGCAEDNDCVIVKDCCGCGGHDLQTAINADFVDDVDARRPVVCGEGELGRPCQTASNSIDEACCAERAVCDDGRCSLFGPHSDIGHLCD